MHQDIMKSVQLPDRHGWAFGMVHFWPFYVYFTHTLSIFFEEYWYN